MIILKLENSGFVIVREEDYVRTVNLTFSKDTHILDASILASVPNNIGMSLQITGNVVSLSKTLLQPGESVTIRVVVDNENLHQIEEYPFTIDARIVGIANVPVVNLVSSRPWWLDRLGAIAVLVGILIVIGVVVLTIARLFQRRQETQ